MSHDAAEGLFRIIDAAYEKRSIALSSNLHPAGFDELMPKTLATATVDRLLHHAHVCQTSGDSVRLTKPSPGKESTPSPNPPRWPTPRHQGGQIRWPPPGTSDGHQRAELMAAGGQKLLALDRIHWWLDVDRAGHVGWH